MTDLKSVKRRKLGQSDLATLPVGMGCMSLSGAYGKSDDDAGIKLIRDAIDLGIDLLDSSDMYGWGHNEELLGRALEGGRRDRITLVTKFGQTQNPGGANGVDGRPEYVMEACDKSLKRLGVDVIDLYFQHRVDPDVPIEDTVGAMAKLIEQGKVRYIGLSEAAPDTIRRAHATHPITCVQSEYSLLYREQAEETLSVTRPLGISFMAYAPLGRSLLTGAYLGQKGLPEDHSHARHPRFAEGNLEANNKIAQAVADMASKKGCTPGQVAIAWVLAQGDDIVTIPGTKRLERLEENIGALDVALSAEDVKTLSDSAPPGAGAGTRYAAAQLKAVYR